MEPQKALVAYRKAFLSQVPLSALELIHQLLPKISLSYQNNQKDANVDIKKLLSSEDKLNIETLKYVLRMSVYQ
jgi:hypothetical protein